MAVDGKPYLRVAVDGRQAYLRVAVVRAYVFTVDTPDVTLTADMRGHGPHVVFVHGTFLNRHVFDGLRESLVDHLVTTAFDLRGHGESTAPRGIDYSLDGYATDLAAVVDTADRPLTLVGWSLGAKTVLRYLDTADVTGIDRIVLVSTGVFHELSDRDTRPAPYVDHEEYRRRVCTGWPELVADFVERLAGDELQEPTRRWLQRQCTATPVHVARAHLDAATAVDPDALGQALEGCPVPVDVFHGARDAAATVTAAREVAERAGGSCTVFERSAHFPFLAEPDRFRTALLDRVRA